MDQHRSDMQASTKIGIDFGRGHLTISLPASANATVLRKRALPKVPDSAAAIMHAMSIAPVNSPPLSEIAKGKTKACILICDITRPVPNHLFLRPMIETLIAQGIARSNITVLVATGLHRPNLGDELAELVGDPWALEAVRVENHFARNDADHIDLGATRTRGTPVRIDRRFVEADLRIATGLVEPHFMAGWSGGPKIIAPGVAGQETIRTFHSSRFMENPLAVQCNLIGNPLREEQLEIVHMIGECYALSTVLNQDRDLACVKFGEIVASHQAAVDFAADAARIPTARKFKTIVTSSAGYPLDKTYYQTIKGMVTPLDVLELGGTLIMASECSEGIGSEEFREAQKRLIDLGPERFLATLMAKSLADIDEWQTEMQLKPMSRGRIELYTTGLNRGDQALTGVHAVSNLEVAIIDAIDRAGDDAIAIIPEGPYVIPYHAPRDSSDRVPYGQKTRTD